jgi:lipid-binding SYLF domain-containing protein
MRTPILTILALGLVMGAALFSPLTIAADKESSAGDRLDASAEVLADMMHAADKGIPQDLMNKAQCVVVVPNMKKAGFIFGAKYGRGYAVCRRRGGSGWTAPAGMRIEGGSFGLQIGGSESDVVVLVNADSGMKHLLEDKFTLGADATVAAGPVGRDASAETDAQLHAEMLSYSRSRGAFAGLALEGATLRPDKDANKELYGREIANREILVGGAVKAPPAAAKLERTLNRESAGK